MCAIDPPGRAGLDGYSTREVARLMGLTPRRVRRFVCAGFVAPAKIDGRAYRFTFQDLVLLRTAKGLLERGMAAGRIRSALRRLAEQLPPGRPLTAVQIWIRGDEIAVRCGSEAWLPGSGQLLFNFDLAEFAGRLEILRPVSVSESHKARGAEDWYRLGRELEGSAPREAVEAYEQALRLNPEFREAHFNLARLLERRGDNSGALRHLETYRRLTDEGGSS